MAIPISTVTRIRYSGFTESPHHNWRIQGTIIESRDFSAMGRDFIVFCWRVGNRSTYADFTESAALRETIRPPDFWPPPPALTASWKRNLEVLEGADSGPQQDCRSVELSNNQVSQLSSSILYTVCKNRLQQDYSNDVEDFLCQAWKVLAY
jgi:hypothetical protein